MNEEQVLAAIFELLSTTGKTVNIGFDEVQEWREGVLESLVKEKLLVKQVQTQSLECSGCENACFMPVVFSDNAARAFIVCDDSEKQSYMGRIAVPLPRLQQWQATAKQVSALVSRLLGLDAKPTFQKESGNYKLGMIKGKKGRRWVWLSVQPLALIINQQHVPLADVLYFENDQCVIDQHRIDELLNSSSINTGKPYTPNTSKREASKLTTQAMYQDWKDEYQRLNKKTPNRALDWYAAQISKLPMAKDRDTNTIKKNMK